MAPAFDFANRLASSLGPETDRWRTEGHRDFYHYRDRRDVPLAYSFYEDALGYEPFPAVTVPTLLLHGRHDEVVDPALAAEFARDRPNVSLELLDTDHSMLDATDRIWSRLKEFHGRARALAA